MPQNYQLFSAKYAPIIISRIPQANPFVNKGVEKSYNFLLSAKALLHIFIGR